MGLLEPHGRGHRLFRRDGLGPYSAPDCFASLAMTGKRCHCEERSDEAISPHQAAAQETATALPVIIIHSLAHAVAALRAAAEVGRPAGLRTPPAAASYAA